MNLLLLACLSAAGCSGNPVNWTLVDRYSPSAEATAVGINPQGATWFFRCDGQSMLSGLRVGKIEAADGQQVTLNIKLDSEPVEQSLWQVENQTYVLRGEPATLLARRAALAYNAVIDDGRQPVKMALTGSHLSMIHMTRTCPFLAVAD
jgi:hypothetical protein